MGYLLTEIVVYLVIAGLIGFAFGWLVKAGSLDKYFEKCTELMGKAKEALKAYYLTLTTTKKVVNEETADPKETTTKQESVNEVSSEKVAEVVELEVKETVKEVAKVEVASDEKIKEEVIEEKMIKETADETTQEVEEANEQSKPELLTEAPKDGADKLSTIKGIGPVIEKKLNELGIYSFEQIASWDAEQELWIGTQMAFPKRVTKEEWAKQAKELMKNK